jgi:hypothetical protein
MYGILFIDERLRNFMLEAWPSGEDNGRYNYLEASDIAEIPSRRAWKMILLSNRVLFVGIEGQENYFLPPTSTTA